MGSGSDSYRVPPRRGHRSLSDDGPTVESLASLRLASDRRHRDWHGATGVTVTVSLPGRRGGGLRPVVASATEPVTG